ncbi:hypothetical protein C8R45DRAFT_1136195 [Mycena sanguinolenta]|nr:hypothetical protein C8R45DRAFT_1136195 [Mycena sanguinolenta]
MVSISDLPPELVDKIVGEFKDDETNLRTCSLISPAFVPSSRKHLFGAVQLLGANVYRFQDLIDSAPFIEFYVRRLYVSVISSQSESVVLAPTTLSQLPNLRHLAAQDDPFDFRNLSPTQYPGILEISLHQPWTLPAWASLLNRCPLLVTLFVSANARMRPEMWSAADVVDRMPQSPTSTSTSTAIPGILRLHTLHVSGDCKVLAPLNAWLIPQGALESLHTLVVDVMLMGPDYDADDARAPLVCAAAASLRELKLFDPPLPNHIAITSFPNLRALYLPYVFDMEPTVSLNWIVAFLSVKARAFLLEMPASMWCTLEDALLGPSLSHSSQPVAAPHPRLHTVTLSAYENKSDAAPDAYEHFTETMRARLPRLVERDVLVIGQPS